MMISRRTHATAAGSLIRAKHRHGARMHIGQFASPSSARTKIIIAGDREGPWEGGREAAV